VEAEVIELRTSEADVLRLRFAVSPLWELLAAVRAVGVGPLPTALRPWRRTVAPPETPLLTALQRGRGYVPDFLTPPPEAGERSIDAEVELVASTPLATVRTEITRCLEAGSLDPLLARTARRPRQARDQVVREMRLAWEHLLRPSWPRLHRVLATDVDHRSRRLVVGGIAALLADLDPRVEWDGRTLRVQSPVRERRTLHGEGVVLMPSAFTVSRPLVILDPPYQPTLVYGARGVATAFTEPVAPADALVRLLGAGRAVLLAALDEPAGTGGLAVSLGRSAGTISEHLHTLRAAGLVEVRRTGKASQWQRTSLGDTLVAGPLST
jgi:DNA-binding transcriptional ArsR family regulator